VGGCSVAAVAAATAAPAVVSHCPKKRHHQHTHMHSIHPSIYTAAVVLNFRFLSQDPQSEVATERGREREGEREQNARFAFLFGDPTTQRLQLLN